MLNRPFSCALAVALFFVACSTTKTNELVPAVATQIAIPRNLNYVRIDVQVAGQESTCYPTPVDPKNPGYVTLPATLGVLADDPSRLVTITVTGFNVDENNVPPQVEDCLTPPFQDTSATGARILRRARLGYVNGKILFVPMPLRYSCYRNPGDAQCMMSETCQASRCVALTNGDASKLVEFRPDMVDGKSSLCFSPTRCMADQVPAKLVDAASCAYEFPSAPAGSGVNVRVYYDGAEEEILDLDPNEGFFIPDATKPQSFTLAPGLCDLVKKAGDPSVTTRKIVAVTAASPCPSKTVAQPICDGCGQARELRPLPSALYIAMDNAMSMHDAFGATGVSRVLGYQLNDPLFHATYVGFKIFPTARSMACDGVSANPFGDPPDVPFDLAPAVQTRVANLLGNQTLQATSPPLYLDVALQKNGIYPTLAAFAQGLHRPLNQVAALFIFDQAPGTDCGAAHASPESEAADALAMQGIHTYAVKLGSGPPSAGDGQAIADKGGGAFYDVHADSTAGVRAFNEIVSTLGTCVYELPPSLDATATLAYANPLSGIETTVPFDNRCSSATPDQGDGWNLESDRVRICGPSCANLRQVRNAIAAAALAQGQPIPNLSVTATQACKK